MPNWMKDWMSSIRFTHHVGKMNIERNGYLEKAMTNILRLLLICSSGSGSLGRFGWN